MVRVSRRDARSATTQILTRRPSQRTIKFPHMSDSFLNLLERRVLAEFEGGLTLKLFIHYLEMLKAKSCLIKQSKLKVHFLAFLELSTHQQWSLQRPINDLNLH